MQTLKSAAQQDIDGFTASLHSRGHLRGRKALHLGHEDDGTVVRRQSFEPGEQFLDSLILIEDSARGRCVDQFWSSGIAFRSETDGISGIALLPRLRTGKIRDNMVGDPREPAHEAAWRAVSKALDVSRSLQEDLLQNVIGLD